MIKPENPNRNKAELELPLKSIIIQAIRFWLSIVLMMFVTYGFTRNIFFGENSIALGLILTSGVVVTLAGFTIVIGRFAHGIIYFSMGYLIWFLLNLLASLFGDQQLGYLLYITLNNSRGLLIFCLIAGLLFRLFISICKWALAREYL